MWTCRVWEVGATANQRHLGLTAGVTSQHTKNRNRILENCLRVIREFLILSKTLSSMKTLTKLPLLFLFLVFTYSCTEDEEVKPELTADFDVKFLPEFKSTIYPSLIFGLSEIEKQEGEAMNYFTINVEPNQETDLRIVIEESKLNFETVITKANVSSEEEIIPSIKWKYDDLKELSQPGNVDMTFVCYGADNEEIGRKDIKLTYRSINECVLAAEVDDEVVPLFFMAAAYVNEDSPVIDDFLQDVLQTTDLDGFVGYQQGPDEVFRQVEAIFSTLRQKGVKYSSITNTSNSNPNVLSQYIRFSDEVLNNTQANCADGTVFFCSILKKIDIHTTLVFVPGHVYLGYYLDADKTSLRLLETTMVGSVGYDFIDASNYQVDSFNGTLDETFNDDFFDGYFMIDIDNAREIIKPIGR